MVEKFLVSIGVGILDIIKNSSYWICMFSSLSGTVAYMIGFKKGIKVTVAGLVIFVFITMLI